jgi:hypothetical protein
VDRRCEDRQQQQNEDGNRITRYHYLTWDCYSKHLLVDWIWGAMRIRMTGSRQNDNNGARQQEDSNSKNGRDSNTSTDRNNPAPPTT